MFTEKGSWFLSLFMALAVSSANAMNHGHDDEHQHHDEDEEHHENQETHTPGAHVHGIGKLLVVLEGEQLDIELLSPAMNLLGFEHKASSAEQQAEVERARKVLADGDSLFDLDSAHCQLTEHSADFSDVTIEGIVDNMQQDEKQDADTHHQQDETLGHSDIEALYRYRCEQPNELRSLSTKISTQFPGLESLEVQWIVNGRQGASTLDNSRHQLYFR